MTHRRDRCLMRRASVAYAVSLVVVVAATLVTCGRFTRVAASCASRASDAHPDADGGRCGWTSPLPDGGRWYAPSWGASRLRARSLGMGRP